MQTIVLRSANAAYAADTPASFHNNLPPLAIFDDGPFTLRLENIVVTGLAVDTPALVWCDLATGKVADSGGSSDLIAALQTVNGGDRGPFPEILCMSRLAATPVQLRLTDVQGTPLNVGAVVAIITIEKYVI